MDVVYDAVIGASSLKQVRRTSFNPGVAHGSLRQSGAVDPSAIVVVGADPKATFETMDIAGAYTALGLTAGLFVSAGTITLPWNRRANGGTFSGGSNNFTLTGAYGLATLQSISGSQSDPGAVAAIDLCFLSSDGLTAPLTAAVNQALASQSYNATHAMGPVYINGSQLTQVSSVRVNTGIRVVTKKYDGGIYVSKAFIETRDPTIDVTFENFDAVNTYGPLFASATNVAAYFRLRADLGTFGADGSGTLHAKFSIASGLGTIQSVEASEQANGQVTISFIGKALAGSIASNIP